MHDNQNALHMTILHSMPGRLRVEFELPLTDPDMVRTVPGLQEYRWNPVIRTLLCRYDSKTTDEFSVLRQLAGIFAIQLHPRLVHVKHAEEPGFEMSPTGWLALIAIGADAAAVMTSITFRPVTQWLATLSTITAVIEHGWEELNERGSFDPEVVSVVYLLNSLSKGATLQASAMAWGLTFGRHLLPSNPRETEWSVREKEGGVVLTPVSLAATGRFAGSLLRSGLDVMAGHKL